MNQWQTIMACSDSIESDMLNQSVVSHKTSNITLTYVMLQEAGDLAL